MAFGLDMGPERAHIVGKVGVQPHLYLKAAGVMGHQLGIFQPDGRDLPQHPIPLQRLQKGGKGLQAGRPQSGRR